MALPRRAWYPSSLMANDRPRPDAAVADILFWQTGYRIVLAASVGGVVVGLRFAGVLGPPAVVLEVVGPALADWLVALVILGYALLAIGVRLYLRTTRRAGEALSTLMAAADIAAVFGLVFLLADPPQYHRGLLVALFSLQLTYVYFGRAPALLMLVATAAAYLLLMDVGVSHEPGITWGDALFTLALFGVGAWLVTRVQSHLHERLAHLVAMFERAEEGDFSDSYDVAADRRPDAITAVGRAYNRMRGQLATIVLTDPLSGCFNRRGFEQQYRRELSRAARAHTDVALLAIDLDHFKAVNDTHGHLVGDRVIAETGELLRANARAQDVVARTGGEEFTILAPDTTPEGAQHLATRIVEAFRRRQFAMPDAQVRVTVSIGVVSDHVRDDGIAEALRARADEALYVAKRSGRDRTVLWSRGLNALHLRQSGDSAVVQ